jgi:hypothetical protein
MKYTARVEMVFALVMVAAGALGGYGLAMALIHMQDAPHSLPHRPVTGNHGQGAMIDARHCPPGAFPYFTDDNLFLTCMRGAP